MRARKDIYSLKFELVVAGKDISSLKSEIVRHKVESLQQHSKSVMRGLFGEPLLFYLAALVF